MTALRGFAAGLVAGLLFAVVPACGGADCSPDTCASGCCSADGRCAAGVARAACGRGGKACKACELTEACQLGHCIGLGSGAAFDGGDSNDNEGNPDASVPLQFAPACTAGAACGGKLEGRYTYLSGCLEDPYQGRFPLCPGGSVQAQSEGFVYGTVTWTATSVDRSERRSWTSTLQVSAPCAAAYVDCAGIQNELANWYAPASCQDTGGGCTCEVGRNGTRYTGAIWHTDGGTVSMGGDSEFWEYCVNGDQLEIRDLTLGEGRGVYRLKKLP